MGPIYKSHAVQWTTNLHQVTSCFYHYILLQFSLVNVNQPKALDASKIYHYHQYQKNDHIAVGQYRER